MVDYTSRRKMLKLTGSIASTTFVAGCTNSSDDDGENSTKNSNDTTENGDKSSNENSTDNNTENSSENDTGNGDSDLSKWDGVETIRMLGNASGWIGVEPEMIADEENPTLVLVEGEQYEFIWENDDGAGHNIEFHDENGDIVNEYSTDVIRGTGEEQTLELEATSDMAEYVCSPHITEMVGEVQIE